jgi:hypothetical protein
LVQLALFSFCSFCVVYFVSGRTICPVVETTTTGIEVVATEVDGVEGGWDSARALANHLPPAQDVGEVEAEAGGEAVARAGADWLI